MFQTENILFQTPGFSGTLEKTPLAEIFGAIARRKASGTLTVEKRDDVRTFFFAEGRLELAISSRPEQRLGAFLRNRGQLSEEHLAEALTAARGRDETYFGEILLEQGRIAPAVLTAEVQRLVERIVQLTFPWSRGTFRFDPGKKAVDPRLALRLDTAAMVFDGVARLPENERFAERLGDPAAMPYRRPKVALPFRTGSPTALFLSRIDGATSCGTLIATGPGNPANAAKLLYGFRCAGWVRWPEDGPQERFDRKRLEETYRRIDWITYYDLLGVAKDAPDDAILRASEEALDAIDGSPDLDDPALSRKRDAVRKTVLEAEEVLRDRSRRAAYDRELSAGSAFVCGNDGGDAALRRDTAVSSYRRARELIQDRDYYPAVKMLEQAVRWAPEVAEYRYLLAVTQRRNPMWTERAIENLREAVRLDPSRADVAAALADALLDRNAVDEAAMHVERASSVPGTGDRHADLIAKFERMREETPQLTEVWPESPRSREEDLKQPSLLDGLTGVGNRRRFDSALAQEWSHAVKERCPLTIVMIDIDHFKAFNDVRGPQGGDEALQIVARSLAQGLQREQDVLTRYGGEEFAVILRPSGPAEAGNVAESFRSKIERLRLPHPASPAGPFLTVSIGVATGQPRRGLSPSALVAAVDDALTRSKRDGRNRVTIVDHAL